MPRWRLATTLDLARIEELSLGVEFEQGVHNWQLYFETSPDTFYVLESEDYGQVVGYLSRNHIGGGVMLNHHIVMLPEFRRRCAVQGLLRQLRQQWPGPVVSNVNAIGLTLLQSYLEHNRIFYGPRFIGYYGFLPDVFPSHLLNGSSSCKNVQLSPVNGNNLDAVLKYDSMIHPYDRRKFMQKWLLPDDGTNTSLSLTAFSRGQVIGYGVMRRMTETYYELAPLYAENDAIAEAIAARLAYMLWLQKGSAVQLYISVLASRKAFLNICQPLSLEVNYHEMRICEGKELALDWSKIYSIQPFWLL